MTTSTPGRTPSAALGAAPLAGNDKPDLATLGTMSNPSRAGRTPSAALGAAPPAGPVTQSNFAMLDVGTDDPDELPELGWELDPFSPFGRSDELLIRRGFVMDDMMEAFSKDPVLGLGQIYVKRQLPNGNIEAGDDTGGVLRDTIAEFWDEFYKKCTVGARSVKVPFLRHDFDNKKWSSIARILKVGYHRVGYFPVQMAPSFMKQVCCIKSVLSPESLLKDFLEFIPCAEKNMLTKAMDDFNSITETDLLEIFDDHNARRVPKAENLRQTVLEIADKEMIQEPMFVINCWREELSGLLTASHIDEVYEKLAPTPRRIVNMLTFPDNLSPTQSDVKKYMLKFVKELDPENAGRFVRFCTGADLICTDNIQVEFSLLQGFQRRPVAHTCAGLLQIPEEYTSYPDFRNEFLSIFSSNIWVMDYV